MGSALGTLVNGVDFVIITVYYTLTDCTRVTGADFGRIYFVFDIHEI